MVGNQRGSFCWPCSLSLTAHVYLHRRRGMNRPGHHLVSRGCSRYCVLPGEARVRKGDFLKVFASICWTHASVSEFCWESKGGRQELARGRWGNDTGFSDSWLSISLTHLCCNLQTWLWQDWPALDRTGLGRSMYQNHAISYVWVLTKICF